MEAGNGGGREIEYLTREEALGGDGLGAASHQMVRVFERQYRKMEGLLDSVEYEGVVE